MKNIIKYTFVLLFSLMGTIAFSQAKKPTIMVVPSDTWCIEKGYTVDFDNYGTIEKKPDHQAAVLDPEMRLVVAKIGEMMSKENFPLERLDATFKAIETTEGKLKYMTGRDGGQIVQTPLERVMQTARPDIQLEFYYKENKLGPRHSVTFEMTAIDPYTRTQVASSSGTSEMESSAIELAMLLQQAVDNHIDAFCAQLQAYFDDLFENGREIFVEFRITDASDFDFYSLVDGVDFCELIEDVMAEKTLNGRFNLLTQDERVLSFNRVRIPLYVNDRAVDAQGWVRRELVRELRRKMMVDPQASGSNPEMKLNINPKVIHEGLGRVTVIL